MIIAILGRQPQLGMAEIESLYGADAVQLLGVNAARVNAVDITIDRLGGTIKLARPITQLYTTNWDSIVKYLINHFLDYLQDIPKGKKITLGLSAYGLPVTTRHLLRAGLELKKAGKQAQHSVRLVPNKAIALNSAQITHNHLTSPHGLELMLIKDGQGLHIAKTIAVQNVDEYAQRDFGRPKRDAFVGMLPPKLAQIMLNLANVQPEQRVLDPFCGTGVVLQEAALLGAQTYGTDLNQKMINYSKQNMAWLAKTYATNPATLSVADATAFTWQQPVHHIVCETYLGQPLSGLPNPEKLGQIISDCNTIIAKFLQNAHGQLAKNSRHCIAVPAWRVKSSFKHLPLLDHLDDLGYNRVRFRHARWEDLIYHREDQVVARELLVVTVR